VAALCQRSEAGLLTDEEIVATCMLLLFGGHETTTYFLGNAVVALAERPALVEALRDDARLTERAVEELLRFDGPVQLVSRVASADLELGERMIRRGERVFPVIAAANRDPNRFERPDELVLAREPNRHLAFAHGGHYCLGAGLARLEAQLALGALSRRFDFALTKEPLHWGRNPSIRGLERLPLELRAR
jgi:cytochrome P450